ncbi:papilin isoform X1 [Sinocyclocheilus anshuiensis]|uniref:papilin isoform X1 n=1 Tax=Sinocyclocheilus anshuiensis TaxID=1608454 RepID=UPI0007BA55AD|nr:PREDICTED: papilin isoform X1 [Sinocyclocheilus anshuiensis]
MLSVVACLQLLLASAFMQPTGDFWDEWGPYGECSRSCGGGVTMRTRLCVTQRTDGGHSCVGPEKSYRSCNIQDCPEGSRDFREEQCSQFDGTDFQGKRYKWLPYYGGGNPCELSCIPRGENFYFRHKTAVVDGTPCHPGGKDICVDGLCKRLGCDNMLESLQEEDPCLQCGGNGQSCSLAKNSFSMRNLPKGYNQMFIIPVGATTIRIKETVPTRNYLAIKNLRGEYYLNGHWVIDFSRATPIAGTVLYYQRGTEGEKTPEIITGRGPTTEPLVIELITQEDNEGVEYEYYLPNGRSMEGYYWSYGSWSACSKECSSGYQSRLVFCTFDDEAYSDYLCASFPRPLSNRTCNEQQCPQTRRMAYVYEPRLWRPMEAPRVYVQVYSWVTGEWSPCPVTCGGGLQVRRVECMSHDSAGSRVVEDSQCASYAPRPLNQQNCNMQKCAQYRVSSWSQCSVTCSSGKQTRDVVCVGSDGASLEDYACGTQPEPPKTQACEMPVCRSPIGWHIGDWGLCSKSCGSGLRERQVICSDRQRNLYRVEECQSKPKPLTVERCNVQPCYRPQEVPSMQDPTGHDNTIQGFLPYIEDPALETPQNNAVHKPHGTPLTPHCSQTYYGCCPDGSTPASGPQSQGCPQDQGLPSCTWSRYGCCHDGVTIAQGPNKEGCPDSWPHWSPASDIPSAPTDCQMSTYGCCYDGVTAAGGTHGEGCSNPPSNTQRSRSCDLPHTVGPCDNWTSRYYYDRSASRCMHFWYGDCHGNSNNFASEEECQRMCLRSELSQRDQAHVLSLQHGGRRFTARIHHSASGATHMHRAHRLDPSAMQQSSPAASWTAVGVSIDKSDPSTVEGLVGQQVVLPCRVSPRPSSTVIVEWRRDGVPVDPARHQQQSDGSLLAGPITLQDSGWFLCVATRDRDRDHRYIYLSVSGASQNGGGISETDSSQSYTSHSSSRFNIDYSSLVEARAGQTAKLRCAVLPVSSMHAVTVHWSRAGEPLNSLRHSQHSDGTLLINQLTSDDSGLYTCTVTDAQKSEERQIQLRVVGDLRITKAPTDVDVPQGSTAQLPCVVTGENVNVGWSRNGVPVRPDGHHVHVSADGTLILNNVQSVDEGTYTCNAYTGTYSVSAAAEVRLAKSPQQDFSGSQGLSPDCVDQPELANCKLIVYARLCSSQYYSSFCCASCARYARDKDGPGQTR